MMNIVLYVEIGVWVRIVGAGFIFAAVFVD